MKERQERKYNPRIAIIDGNTLAAIGLRQLLTQVMPIATIEIFSSVRELEDRHSESFMHYFVAMSIVLSHRVFFEHRRRMTFVLTLSPEASNQLFGFRCLYVGGSEEDLVHALLALEQTGHAGGRNLPSMPADAGNALTPREAEVLSLVARGLMNKEIAEWLHISVATVITHRKNIQVKLGMKSVSALTIYAVVHGLVDVNKI